MIFLRFAAIDKLNSWKIFVISYVMMCWDLYLFVFILIFKRKHNSQETKNLILTEKLISMRHASAKCAMFLWGCTIKEINLKKKLYLVSRLNCIRMRCQRDINMVWWGSNELAKHIHDDVLCTFWIWIRLILVILVLIFDFSSLGGRSNW